MPLYCTIRLLLQVKSKLLLKINFETVLCYKLLPNMERVKGKKKLVPLVAQVNLVKHESKIFSSEPRVRCQYCQTADTITNWTNRKFPDYQFQPALCQTVKRYCQNHWHEAQFDDSREAWFSKKLRRSDNQSLTQPIQSNQAESQACSLIIYPMTLFLSYYNVEGDLVDQRTRINEEGDTTQCCKMMNYRAI